MKAVILAAGMGTRLGNITRKMPKCLIEINGKSIIEYQLEALKENGIDDVIVVVGYRFEAIMERLENSVRYVKNEISDKSNSSYSLWCARDYLTDGWLHMNCDLLFSQSILKDVLLPENSNSIVADLDLKLSDDQEKVWINNGIITEMRKTDSPQGAYGKTIGMARFSPEGAKIVLNHLDEVVKSGEKNRWFFSIISDVLQEVPFRAVPTEGKFWAEIDTVEDLKQARLRMQARKAL